MPVLDRLFLNPFEKWSRYGRFPCAFLLHLVLLILVTAQAVLLFNRDVQHVSRTVRHFAHLFVGSYTTAYGQPVTLHEPSALQQAFSRAVRNHFFINNVSVVNFELVHPEALAVQVRWRNGTVDPMRIEFSGFAEPFSEAQAESYLRTTVPFLYDNHVVPQVAMVSLEHAFREIGYIPGGRTAWVVACAYNWNVSTLFDGRQAGEFLGRVTSRASDCQGEWRPLHVVHVACLGLALLRLVLILRKFWRSSRILVALKSNAEAWERLTRSDVLMLFSPWWLLAVVMHAVQIASCIVCLSWFPDIGERFQSVGFSCFLTWLTMCQYFESFPGYYMAFHTLGISAGRVFRFLCSVGPLFIGFVLLGVCLFWRSRVFVSPGAAAATLFSLMNGDMIHDTFDEVYGIGGLVAHLFLYSFIMIFTYVILNVNISIVTDAYERAKRHPQRESAKLLRQHHREERVRRTTSNLSPPSSPPDSPRYGRAPSTSFAPELPERRPSRVFQGYMSPRFFQSKRIQEALAAAFPEEFLLEHDSLAAAPPAEARSVPGASAGSAAIDDNMELATVSHGWEDFDRVLAKVQASTAELRRVSLPVGGEAARQLASRMEGLDGAASSLAAARERADSRPRRQECVTEPTSPGDIFAFELPPRARMAPAAAEPPRQPV